MKLISDFDGVWTRPHQEASCVRDETLRTVAELTGAEPALVERAFEAVNAAMDQDPERYGWTIKGQISAFSDEDPFVRNNAAGHFIDVLAQQPSRIADAALRELLLAWRSAALRDHEDMNSFANAMFGKATAEYRERVKPRPSDVVVAAMHRLLEGGHDIVIVSNSSTQKIADFLSRSSLPYVTGGVEAQQAGRIRVRGGAMKFLIADDAGDVIALGDRQVRCDRPSYEAILEEEGGDAVVGDVVSLDFALPWKMRQAGRLEMDFFLVEHDYTPRWSRGLCGEAGLTGITGLERIAELWA